MSKMSERIFIGNDEDINIKLKIEDESEPRSAKELKEIPQIPPSQLSNPQRSVNIQVHLKMLLLNFYLITLLMSLYPRMLPMNLYLRRK
jgi:hypothetical protein